MNHIRHPNWRALRNLPVAVEAVDKSATWPAHIWQYLPGCGGSATTEEASAKIVGRRRTSPTEVHLLQFDWLCGLLKRFLIYTHSCINITISCDSGVKLRVTNTNTPTHIDGNIDIDIFDHGSWPSWTEKQKNSRKEGRNFLGPLETGNGIVDCTLWYSM